MKKNTNNSGSYENIKIIDVTKEVNQDLQEEMNPADTVNLVGAELNQIKGQEGHRDQALILLVEIIWIIVVK